MAPRPPHGLVADRASVGARIDQLIANKEPPGARWQHASHDLDQRRLAGTVVADQAYNLVASDFEIDVTQGMDRAEIFLHALHTHDVGKIRGRVLMIIGFDHNVPENGGLAANGIQASLIAGIYVFLSLPSIDDLLTVPRRYEISQWRIGQYSSKRQFV